MLCSDGNCKHRGDEGYYGICNLYKERCGNRPLVVGMTRYYVETCGNKEVEVDGKSKDSD